jgi:outer membrane lipopolysaccharide assembly protein LptE/RlpB
MIFKLPAPLFVKTSVALIVSLLISGCGYAFQGSGTVLPEDIKTIAIRVSENQTTETGLGYKFTEKLQSRFERYGAVKIVDPDEDADAELITRILNIETSVRDVTSDTDIELEQDIILTVFAELRRRNGQVLYRNPALRTRDSFATVSDVVVTSSSSFAQAGITASSLDSLGSREVSRGAQSAALDDLLDESARQLYLDAVAAEF